MSNLQRGFIPSKKCFICAQEKPLNDFHSRNIDHDVSIQLEPYISNWLENFLIIKAQVLLGSLELYDNTLAEIPKKDLTRDIKIITDIVKEIKRRSVSYDGFEIDLFEHFNSQERRIIEQTKHPTFRLRQNITKRV